MPLNGGGSIYPYPLPRYLFFGENYENKYLKVNTQNIGSKSTPYMISQHYNPTL